MTATIELNSARRKLEIALGDNKSVYFTAMKKWFRLRRCSKEDFDCEAKKLLSADDSHLHNEFLLAILNKCQTLANFTLMTSPTVKTPGSLPNVLSPSSSSIGSPNNPFFAARPSPNSDGVRLKDYRNPAIVIPDCDEFEIFDDPTERSVVNQKEEPTIPDSSMVTARFLIASWDEGLDGSINDPSATELVVAGVNQLLRRIITSILMDKSGYVSYANKMPHAIGIAAPNPYLINKQRANCNGISSTEDPIHETPEILESLNFTSATNNVDPLVPTGRPHERESELKAMWDLACTHRYTSRAEDQIKIVTLFDLLSTLKKHRTLIPSHTVYSINMERLLCRLHHEGHTMASVINEKRDVTIPEKPPTELLLDKHIEFLVNYGKGDTKFEFEMAEFLRINGVYWSYTALHLMDAEDRLDKEKIVKFLNECRCENGGYAPTKSHDPCLLYTLSAVQIAAELDIMANLDKDSIVHYVKELQKPDGSFMGDKWGEVDTRFSFCAVAILALLDSLEDYPKENLEAAVSFVKSSMNFDGGFGSRPSSESHAGQIYCCLGFLSIVHRLDIVDADLLGYWLAERQLKSGGLNGRPEKLPDVCYSWWVLASLAILGRLHWIDHKKLENFVKACQDDETGGISDRPGDLPDPFHTLFGVAGLSLLGCDSKRLRQVNPVFCMPQKLITMFGIKIQTL